MVNFDEETLTVPPILRNFHFSNYDAMYYAKKKLCEYYLGFDLTQLPCHTQSVERCVKIVTKASRVVFGESRRDGLIINALQSRNAAPLLRTKSDLDVYKPYTTQASV